MEFIICPKCSYECGRFIEITEELCIQYGVMISVNGELDYGNADCVENFGETVRVIGYQCEECETVFNLVNGELEEQGVLK